MLPFADSIPIRTSVKRLDDALKAQGIQKIDLLRVDVNGYEPNVLEGASQYLNEGRIAAILCAFDAFWLEKNGSSREGLYELLSSYGYGSPVAKVALDIGEKSVLLVLNP